MFTDEENAELDHFDQPLQNAVNFTTKPSAASKLTLASKKRTRRYKEGTTTNNNSQLGIGFLSSISPPTIGNSSTQIYTSGSSIPSFSLMGEGTSKVTVSTELYCTHSH